MKREFPDNSARSGGAPGSPSFRALLTESCLSGASAASFLGVTRASVSQWRNARAPCADIYHTRLSEFIRARDALSGAPHRIRKYLDDLYLDDNLHRLAPLDRAAMAKVLRAEFTLNVTPRHSAH